MTRDLPLPSFFHPASVSQVWRVPYQERAEQATEWARIHALSPSALDAKRICLLIIDAQNTFCLPDFELFVGGRSGMGAVEDNVRLCQFIYRNLGIISEIALTMDTHSTMQIFHPLFWLNRGGAHPAPHTTISTNDIEQGIWRVNPGVAASLGIAEPALQRHALHYAQQLHKQGKFQLTIWPFHGMLGGIGHAIVSSVEEAAFFHAVARSAQNDFQIKGTNPLTENYSVLRPEVMTGQGGQPIAQKNAQFVQKLLKFDAVIIAGQAKSHCVAWTIDDLLTEIQALDPQLAQKVYLLEDCSSPVVVPGVVDFTEAADAAFHRFEMAGMHIVRSTDPIWSWSGTNA